MQPTYPASMFSTLTIELAAAEDTYEINEDDQRYADKPPDQAWLYIHGLDEPHSNILMKCMLLALVPPHA